MTIHPIFLLKSVSVMVALGDKLMGHVCKDVLCHVIRQRLKDCAQLNLLVALEEKSEDHQSLGFIT